MKLPINKKHPWTDMLNGDPLLDVRMVVSRNPFARSTLHLTTESVRALFQHPAICTVPRRDWCYLFQVDAVTLTTEDTDFIQFEAS